MSRVPPLHHSTSVTGSEHPASSLDHDSFTLPIRYPYRAISASCRGVSSSLHTGAISMQATSDNSITGKPLKRIALEEHFVLNEPEHIDRWLTLIPNIPPAAREKILSILVDT